MLGVLVVLGVVVLGVVVLPSVVVGVAALVGLIVRVVAVVARDVAPDAEVEPGGGSGGVEAVQPATDRTSAAPTVGVARRAAPHRLRDLTN